MTGLRRLILLGGSIIALACCQLAVGGECTPGNLLRHATARAEILLLHPERLTDDTLVEEGYSWENEQSALIAGPALYFDLGSPIEIKAMLVQGDHRGSYTISGSLDSERWFTLWITPAAEGPGMRLRSSVVVAGAARYLRVENPRAPGAYAISEIQAYCAPPQPWPPSLQARSGKLDLSLTADTWAYTRSLDHHRLTVAVFGLLVFFGLALQRAEQSSLARRAASALAGLSVAYLLHRATKQTHPLEQALQLAAVGITGLALFLLAARRFYGRIFTVRLERGRAAALAVLLAGTGALLYAVAVAVAYAFHSPIALPIAAGLVLAALLLVWVNRSGDWQAASRAVALAALTVASAYSFTSFGAFYDWRDLVKGEGAGAIYNTANPWRPVIYHDQFHYYMGSKYFREIGYDKLYRCAALAERDNGRGALVERQRVRDLTTNLLHPGAAILAKAEPCREQFTPQRWEAFRADVYYFRTRVGIEASERYLTDHGYNATPLWTAFNRFIVSGTRASDGTQVSLAMIDVGLLAGAFALLCWAFGAPAAVLAALVWGTTRIWMYMTLGGVGSFGRFYSVFAVVAGCCLLKKQKLVLGGFSLAVALLLRVFPGALLFGPGVAFVHQLVVKRRLDTKHGKVLAGAALALAVLGSFSLAATNGLETYRGFLVNAMKHANTPLTNNIGLKTLFSSSTKGAGAIVMEPEAEDPYASWKQKRRNTFEQRMAWYWLAVIALMSLSAAVCVRVHEPWRIVPLGVLPMFCIFDLTNYYYALSIVLAPLAIARLQHVVVLLAATIAGQLAFRYASDLMFPLYSALVLGMLLYFLAASWHTTKAQA